LAADDNFCSKCGTKTDKQAAPESAPAAAPEYVQNIENAAAAPETRGAGAAAPEWDVRTPEMTDGAEASRKKFDEMQDMDRFDWDIEGYPSSEGRKTEDIDFHWDSVADMNRRIRRRASERAELEASGVSPFGALKQEEPKPVDLESIVRDDDGTAPAVDTEQLEARAEAERSVPGFERDTPEPETKSRSDEGTIDSFFTYNSEKDEFQELLDKEQKKLRTGADDDFDLFGDHVSGGEDVESSLRESLEKLATLADSVKRDEPAPQSVITEDAAEEIPAVESEEPLAEPVTAGPEPVFEAEPAAAPEIEAEPVTEPAPVIEAEPAPEAEPIAPEMGAEPAAEPEPVIESEPAAEPEAWIGTEETAAVEPEKAQSFDAEDSFFRDGDRPESTQNVSPYQFETDPEMEAEQAFEAGEVPEAENEIIPEVQDEYSAEVTAQEPEVYAAEPEAGESVGYEEPVQEAVMTEDAAEEIPAVEYEESPAEPIAAEPEFAVEPEMPFEAEPAAEAEPVFGGESEPVAEPEFAAAPEPVAEPEFVAESEVPFEAEPAAEAEPVFGGESELEPAEPGAEAEPEVWTGAEEAADDEPEVPAAAAEAADGTPAPEEAETGEDGQIVDRGGITGVAAGTDTYSDVPDKASEVPEKKYTGLKIFAIIAAVIIVLEIIIIVLKTKMPDSAISLKIQDIYSVVYNWFAGLKG
jgi:hypothetical protein